MSNPIAHMDQEVAKHMEVLGTPEATTKLLLVVLDPQNGLKDPDSCKLVAECIKLGVTMSFRHQTENRINAGDDSHAQD